MHKSKQLLVYWFGECVNLTYLLSTGRTCIAVHANQVGLALFFWFVLQVNNMCYCIRIFFCIGCAWHDVASACDDDVVTMAMVGGSACCPGYMLGGQISAGNSELSPDNPRIPPDIRRSCRLELVSVLMLAWRLHAPVVLGSVAMATRKKN